MEHNDPSRRQYAPNAYAAQQSQQTSTSAQGQYRTPSSVERFRQPSYAQQSPSSGGRMAGDTQQLYGFTPGAQYSAGTTIQSSPGQYGQDMPSPEAQRQPTHQYQPYGANIMYGMAQAQATQPTQSPYEQVPQYRQRAGTGSEALTSQFGVPQATQYYLAGQPGPTSAAAPELAAQNIPSQYPQPDLYAQAGPSSAHPYPSSMMDPTQSAGYSTYGQSPQYGAVQRVQSDDQHFDRYQNQIRNIFTLVRNGSLSDIGGPLLEVSQYLLGNVEHLGLVRDEESLHDERIRFWDEFNRAWLTTLQRQLDLTQEMIQTGNSQSIMNAPTLERLSHELVRLCDSVERHGLVDYQMGVMEEEIMDLLLRCLAQLRPSDEGSGEPGLQAESSVAGRARGR